MTRDFVTAARALRREPGFVAIVVLTFALAIAANAAMFGLVNRLMLSPPPGIANADRVARVRLWLNEEGGESFAMSTTSYPRVSGAARIERCVLGRRRDAARHDARRPQPRRHARRGTRRHRRLLHDARCDTGAGAILRAVR